MHISVSEILTIVCAVLAIEVGILLHRLVPQLEKCNIPTAITGGLTVAIAITLLRHFFDIHFSFATGTRNILLLIFFAGIGLSAKFKELIRGGKGVALLCVVIVVMISVQNTMGVLIAYFFDLSPSMGFFFGSISFTGGHGTAAAWSNAAPAQHLVGAFEVGMACATVGLIAGGVVAGPVATGLINLQKRRGKSVKSQAKKLERRVTTQVADLLNTDNWLMIVLILGICLVFGDNLREWLETQGVVIPAFLAAMFIAIILTNLADIFKRTINMVTSDLIGTIALRLFLAMSMMGLQLWELTAFLTPLLVTVLTQVLVAVIIAIFVLYPLLGRDYEAAVTCGGFIGVSLGAMPVASGVMQRLAATYGPAPKAILLLTLAAALFTDTANALLVNFGFSLLGYIHSPF